MPVFITGEPVTTLEPGVEADRLPVGEHTFELVVVDSEDRRSEPASVVITVVRTRPTARLAEPTGPVELGNAAGLDGRESTAVLPATLTSWEWTLKSPSGSTER